MCTNSLLHSGCTAEMLLLPVSKNKRPPCWNFTSGSDFYVCVTIGMSFCIFLPNFDQIGPYVTELWGQIDFSRRRPQYRNSTSGFGFRDFAYLGRSKSTRIPNFVEISQSTAISTKVRYNKNGIINLHLQYSASIYIFLRQRPTNVNSPNMEVYIQIYVPLTSVLKSTVPT